jgi:peptidoglycan/LPS O-acetylase OafA/YrhL
VGNTIWGTVVAGILAVASWFLVEAPAMRMKSRFRIKPAAGPDAESAETKEKAA